MILYYISKQMTRGNVRKTEEQNYEYQKNDHR